MIAVTCALIIVDNKLLITQRGNHTSNAGLWEFPGGKVHAGESNSQCIIREIKEELNIDIVPLLQLPPLFAEIELIPFICNGFEGEIILREHQSLEFCHLSQLNRFNLTPADKALCAYITENSHLIEQLAI